MTKNPLFNALGASGYIILVVSLLNFIGKTNGNKPDTAAAPIVFLSLLTLSVAVMAYFFFFQPMQLFMDGKKKESANLLVRTIGIFAIFTSIVVILLLSGLI